MPSPTFSSLAPESSKASSASATSATPSTTSTTTTHSHTRKPSASNPIVRPGPNAAGPTGFSAEQQQQQQQPNQPQTQEDAAEGAGLVRSNGSGGGGTIKDKVRKVGEKLAFVQPKDVEGLKGSRAEAARQNASTMPE